MDAVLCALSSGRAWRLLPLDFPPWQTVHCYLRAWRGNGACASEGLATWCAGRARVELRVVRRRERHRFEVLPKGRIVERMFACLGRNRRLARDYEGRARTTELLIEVAMIDLTLRRLVPS